MSEADALKDWNDHGPAPYQALSDLLRDCYACRRLPTWGNIHDAADAIEHLMILNRLMVPGAAQSPTHPDTEGARLANWLADYSQNLMEDGDFDQEADEILRASQWIADALYPVASTQGYDHAFVEEIKRADASPPEASFDNVKDALDYLNDTVVPSTDRRHLYCVQQRDKLCADVNCAGCPMPSTHQREQFYCVRARSRLCEDVKCAGCPMTSTHRREGK